MDENFEPLTLGFIGLGAMGWPMCGHLQRAGHRLRVWARDAGRRERAAAAGMQVCASAVDVAALALPVVQPVFQDAGAGGAYKVISFHAKRARGMMARWAIEQRVDDPQALKGFDAGGYAWAPAASSETRWVFRRG